MGFTRFDHQRVAECLDKIIDGLEATSRGDLDDKSARNMATSLARLNKYLEGDIFAFDIDRHTAFEALRNIRTLVRNIRVHQYPDGHDRSRATHDAADLRDHLADLTARAVGVQVENQNEPPRFAIDGKALETARALATGAEAAAGKDTADAAKQAGRRASKWKRGLKTADRFLEKNPTATEEQVCGEIFRCHVKGFGNRPTVKQYREARAYHGEQLDGKSQISASESQSEKGRNSRKRKKPAKKIGSQKRDTSPRLHPAKTAE